MSYLSKILNPRKKRWSSSNFFYPNFYARKNEISSAILFLSILPPYLKISPRFEKKIIKNFNSFWRGEETYLRQTRRTSFVHLSRRCLDEEFLPSKKRENLGGSFPSIEIALREVKGEDESVAARPMNHPWKYALEKEEFVVSFRLERKREFLTVDFSRGTLIRLVSRLVSTPGKD